MIKFSVILLIKNGEEYITYLNNYFNKIEKLYASKYTFEYFMYENNSTDNTKDKIKKFYEKRKGKYFLENINNSKNIGGIDIARGTYMAMLRNKLKNYHGILKSNYTILIDCDVVFTDNIIENMVNLFDKYEYTIGPSDSNTKVTTLPIQTPGKIQFPSNEQNSDWNDNFDVIINKNEMIIKRLDSDSGWGQNLKILLKSPSTLVAVTPYDVCYDTCVNGFYGHYYDSLAMITDKNISYKENDNTCMFKKCDSCNNHRKVFNVNISDDLLLDDNNLINVHSAFGGFLMIKTSIYNNIKWENTVCEHHSFCESLRKYGEILLDPTRHVITTIPKYTNYIEIEKTLNKIYCY